jgi:D-glycero-D-manno-heptose 1,7-bisphosphate phosphatase
MDITAIILCGGKATRLGALAEFKPKILMPLYDKFSSSYKVMDERFNDPDFEQTTMLDAQIELLVKNGITNIVLAIGHLGDEIRKYVAEKYSKEDLSIEFSEEEEPLGTGGAIWKAYQENCNESKVFVALNGDVYCPEVDFTKMIKTMRHETNYELGRQGAMVLANHPIPYGVVEVGAYGGVQEEGDSRVNTIHRFSEKKGVWINAGIYVLTPQLFEYMDDEGREKLAENSLA